MYTYTYDATTDHFMLNGEPVAAPHFSPEAEMAWESWLVAHGEFDEEVWAWVGKYDGPDLWRDNNADYVPGYMFWDGESDDAADSTADDLDEPGGEMLIARSDIDYGTPVYPDHELSREHHECPVWGVYTVVEDGEEWHPELIRDGLTLAEAQKLTVELGATRVLG